LVAAMPAQSPACSAAASAASTTRRRPSRPARTSGASAGGAAPPSCLLTRSVDQVGRKSETTLRIASLHVETGGFAAATADEFEPPAGAPDARHRQRHRRQRADAPARDGSGGLGEVGGVFFPCRPFGIRERVKQQAQSLWPGPLPDPPPQAGEGEGVLRGSVESLLGAYGSFPCAMKG